MPPSDPNWLTPNRHTRLVLDYQSAVSIRPAFTTTRQAQQIAATRSTAAATADVSHQPGNAWTLRPHRDDNSRVLDTGWGGALRAADVNLGAGFGEVPTFRKPTDLPGVSPSTSLVVSGSYAFYKLVPAGSSWSSHLSADAAAMPQPTLESADLPMDRVLSSKTSYPANAGFVVVLRLPPDYNAIDTLYTFYFGGPNSVLPVGSTAGQFSLTLRGSGKAILSEWDGSEWLTRLTFNAFANLQGNMASVLLRVFPYGPDTIAVSGGSADGEGRFSGPFQNEFLGLAAKVSASRTATFYRNNPALSGYRSQTYMTGAGPVRLDMRRDLRTYVQIIHLKLPATGTLVDLPFWIPFPVPAGTPLVVTAKSWLPSGTSLGVQLYDATTHLALPSIAINGFESVANQQAYYAAFSFAADSAQAQTPVLYRYQIDALGQVSERHPVSITGGILRHVAVTGPDLDPSQETASVSVQDPKNELALLRGRGRVPGRLAVYDDAGALTTVLFEGEVNLATATRRGRPGYVYPSPLWHEFDCQMVGQWAKLAEFINMSLIPYDQDPQGRLGPDGGVAAWRVTDIIRDLLGRIGYTAAQLDIPDVPIHLFSEGQSQEDFMLVPTVAIGEFIKTLAEKYLAMTLFWDPNAGLTGKWRLLAQNVTGGPILARFVGTAPLAGQLVHHGNSYPAGYAWIEAGSYREEVRAPEANFVLVAGAEMTYPSLMSSSMYNPKSWDFLGPTSDPSHIDYLGRFVPLVHVDPTLTTKNATQFVCRRLYNFVAHGLRWLKFRAPLLLVADPSDAQQSRRRPLRLQDAISVLGRTCIVRSCNPSWDHDGIQMCDVECVEVTA